jgi:hypothetical protein
VLRTALQCRLHQSGVRSFAYLAVEPLARENEPVPVR